MPNTIEHGKLRAGLLTSSTAKIIMRGRPATWASLRRRVWHDSGESFTSRVSDATEYGHEHEGEGAAKFVWDHPEYDLQPFGSDGQPPFFLYMNPKRPTLKGMLASSPDRILLRDGRVAGGLEVKSPTTPETFAKHKLRSHMDQCQHGLLVTGLPVWWLVVHHADLYKEWMIEPDRAWRKKYLERAEKFIEFAYEDAPVKHRKIRFADL